MSTFNVITQPIADVVTLSDMYTQLRLDSGVSDSDVIELAIATATEYCQAKSGKAFITQTLEMRFDKWADSKGFELLSAPIQSVDFIKYYDKDGVLHTVDSSDYIVETSSYPARIILAYGKAWVSDDLRPGNSIIIQYKAGYGDAKTDVPAHYRQAIILLAAYYYENREAAIMPLSSGATSGTAIPFGVDVLLRTKRRVYR